LSDIYYMKPSEVANRLRIIANKLDSSIAPQKNIVARDIRAVLLKVADQSDQSDEEFSKRMRKETVDLKNLPDLVELTQLSEEVAKILYPHRHGRDIDLSGLTSLDDSVAKILIIRGFRSINLSGLKTLNIDTADVLAKYLGRLFLNGLTSVDDELIDAFASSRAESLTFDGLSEDDREYIEDARHKYWKSHTM